MVLGGAAPLAGQSANCDAACLERIARDYRSAYRAHDRSLAPFAGTVRYTENNIEMPFPDGTWDTVTAEPGPPLVLSDPHTGHVAIFTSVMQDEIAGFLAIRLHVNGEGKIDEVEHILSTRRTLSSPPTPIGNILEYVHEPVINEATPADARADRAALEAHAHGYFDTLQMNDGEIRGTCFHDTTTRRENGLLFSEVKADFERGRYRFNNRVRRDVFMVDEARQVAVGRGFIDHKGVLNEYLLTNGTEVRSIFQEPQSWGLLEAFKVKDGCIAAVVATFYQAPYYQKSPWTDEPGR
jgi:hypothetical protein